MMTAIAVVQGLEIVFVALLVGFMAVVEWSLVPAQNRLDARGYAVLEQGMNRVLTRLTPALMISALLAAGASAGLAVAAGLATAWWHAIATISLVAMVVSTLIINAPVNSEIDTWDPASPPATWRASRDRWEFGHRLRTYVGLVALLAVAVAAVI